MSKTKKIRKVDELLEIAKQEYAEFVESTVRATDWEKLNLDTGIKITDFVEKRFAGLNENALQILHDLDVDEQRLNQTEDSPRKTAALAVWKKYRECCERQMELRFECQLFAEAQKYLYQPNRYTISDEVQRDFHRRENEQAREYLAYTEKLTVYQNFMDTFFRGNALPSLDGAEPGSNLSEKEQEFFAEMTEALPDSVEYEAYKTRAGYENQKPMEIHPSHAVLEMNPNILTDIKADEYPSKIRMEHPSRLDLEWGASTFDKMMESLYNQEEQNEIQRRGYSYLNTVFLDGKPAVEVFPIEWLETPADYERRVRAEVVASALEANRRIDIAPYRFLPDQQVEFKEAIPVKAKVNIEETLSGWKKFLHFFGITVNLVKRKAEKMSLKDLEQKERAAEIHNKTAELAKRENESYRMKQRIADEFKLTDRNDEAFFGFLTEEMHLNPEENAARKRDSIFPGFISAEVPSSYLNGSEHTEQKKTVTIMETMYRTASRQSVVGLYALTKGMALDELLSEDPKYDARKREIGVEFFDRVHLLKEEEFYKKHGEDADYKAYFAQKSQDICNLFVSLNEMVANQPIDLFKDCSVKNLTENYTKLSFLINAAQDLDQCCPKHIKQLGGEEFDKLEVKNRAIGEFRSMKAYCDYIGSDFYVQPVETSKAQQRVIRAVRARVCMEEVVEACQSCTVFGEFLEHLDTATNKRQIAENDLVANLSGMVDEPGRFQQFFEYASTGKNPIVVYDAKEEKYQIGTPKEIAKLRLAIGKDKQVDWKDFEEVADLEKIVEKRRLEREPAAKISVKDLDSFSKEK